MMAAWASAIRAKARGCGGESITEVLVAIVVSGLAILMLATVIAAAASANASSRKAMDDYYADNNALVAGAGTSAQGSVTLTEQGAARVVRLADGTDAVSIAGHVYEQSDGTLVISYDPEEG